MSLFQLLGILVTLVALLGYVNRRWLKLPSAIGLTGRAFAGCRLLVALGRFDSRLLRTADAFVHAVRFDTTLLRGMLGYLLFAGARNVDLARLRRHAGPVSAARIGLEVITLHFD